MVCMGHLYGVSLYYATSYAEHYFRGIAHSRPEFVYFWVYYAGFNFPWVLVPLSKWLPYTKAMDDGHAAHRLVLLTRSIRTLRGLCETLGRVQALVSNLNSQKAKIVEDMKSRRSEGAKTRE